LKTLTILLVTIILFFLDCREFHYPVAVGMDILSLALLIAVPGTLLIRGLNARFSLAWSPLLILSIGSALGFGLFAASIEAAHQINLAHTNLIVYLCLGIISCGGIAIGWRLPLFKETSFKQSSESWSPTFQLISIVALAVLLWFTFYNLHQFYFGTDGSVHTRQVFGIDLPFLAGEVHGLRNFGVLRDLHQAGQPWYYHDATYQVLSILPRARTVEAVAFTAPFVGYLFLALSTYALLHHLTKSNSWATFGVLGFFLIGHFTGTEKGIYDLSPSLLFGTFLLVAILLALDRWKEVSTASKVSKPGEWIIALILLSLVLELEQTKLSSFLVVAGALVILAFLRIRHRPRHSVIMLGIVAIGLLLLLRVTSENLFMPAGDALIGFPLIGYAKFFSALLRIPLADILPVFSIQHIGWNWLRILPYIPIHLARAFLADPRSLAFTIIIVLCGSLLLERLKSAYAQDTWVVLILLIPLGWMLPVLYTPAWYAVALTFYTPLVSMEASLFAAMLGVWFLSSLPNSQRRRWALTIVAILFAIGVVQNARFYLRDRQTAANIVPASLVHGLRFLEEEIPDTTLVATRRYNSRMSDTALESYYWYAALSGHPVVSEGAASGSLLAGVAETNTLVGLHPVPAARAALLDRRVLLDTIYLSRDSAMVGQALRTSRVSFILEDKTIGQHLMIDPHLLCDPIFENDGCKIWKVRN
jgi:hypothetical protein